MALVLTADAVPGGDGPSLLELELFSLMVSDVIKFVIVSFSCPQSFLPSQVKLRLVLPSMLYQESGDGSTTPVLKSIVGLNSPISSDQCVFQASLLARVVQILLTTSPDLPSEGITKAYFL